MVDRMASIKAPLSDMVNELTITKIDNEKKGGRFYQFVTQARTVARTDQTRTSLNRGCHISSRK